MVTATEHLAKNPKYKSDFYVSGRKLFCKVCQVIVNYEKKSTIDNYLKSDKHTSNSNKPVQSTLLQVGIKFFKQSDDIKETFIKDFLQIMVQVDISIEKADYFKSFLMKYCKN
ncbi:21003_t:CDS:1, partial [Cetraspora pellucida]